MTQPDDEVKEPGVPASEFPDGDQLDSRQIVDDGAPDDDL